MKSQTNTSKRISPFGDLAAKSQQVSVSEKSNTFTAQVYLFGHIIRFAMLHFTAACLKSGTCTRKSCPSVALLLFIAADVQKKIQSDWSRQRPHLEGDDGTCQARLHLIIDRAG